MQGVAADNSIDLAVKVGFGELPASCGGGERIDPCGFPAGPQEGETEIFDDSDSCAVNHNLDDAALDRVVNNIRVVRVDGGSGQWDVDPPTTLREILLQDWHGTAGENDKFKQVAGDSNSPSKNLYVFGDGDAANYDREGCRAANMGFGAPQDTCPGTPFGLISMGHVDSGAVVGDFGECNCKSSPPPLLSLPF